MSIAIRPATHADASPLRSLAEATFRQAFAEANTPADMEQYVATAFTEAQQAADIADPRHIVLLAEHTDDDGKTTLIGYADLVLGSMAECVHGPAPVEMKRIYIEGAWHGKHAAQTLLDAAMGAARDRGAQTLWLGVWEHNPRAAAFYRKYGFERVGEQTFKLGQDLQLDWIMVRGL